MQIDHTEECRNRSNKYRICMDHSIKNFWKKEIVWIPHQSSKLSLMHGERLLLESTGQ